MYIVEYLIQSQARRFKKFETLTEAIAWASEQPTGSILEVRRLDYDNSEITGD